MGQACCASTPAHEVSFATEISRNSHHRTLVQSPTPPREKETTKCPSCTIIAASCLVALVSLLGVLAFLRGQSLGSNCQGFLAGLGCTNAELDFLLQRPTSYYVMVDCGSSGTRLKLFRMEEGKVKQLPLGSEAKMDALSSYVGRLDELQPDIKSMVDASLDKVPEKNRAETPLFMYATAGMRLLPAEDQHAVFAQCRELLRDSSVSPYQLEAARTLSGEMEAAFQYLSVNYQEADGVFADNTIGQLEMGGASMQVAFHPVNPVLDNSWVYDLLGKREMIYAKSFPGFGQNIARKKTQEAAVRAAKARRLTAAGGAGDSSSDAVTYPCLLKGYNESATVFEGTDEEQTVLLVGSSDYSGCHNLTEEILHKEYECDLGPCPFHGDYMTQLSGQRFVGISGFKYALLNLHLDLHSTTPGELKSSVEDFCSQNFTELGRNSKYTRYECFLGTYTYSMLHALGFEDDSTALNCAGDYSWTLGAVVYEAFAASELVNSSAPTRRRLTELPVSEALPAMDPSCYWACRERQGCAELRASGASACKRACSSSCSSA